MLYRRKRCVLLLTFTFIRRTLKQHLCIFRQIDYRAVKYLDFDIFNVHTLVALKINTFVAPLSRAFFFKQSIREYFMADAWSKPYKRGFIVGTRENVVEFNLYFACHHLIRQHVSVAVTIRTSLQHSAFKHTSRLFSGKFHKT